MIQGWSPKIILMVVFLCKKAYVFQWLTHLRPPTYTLLYWSKRITFVIKKVNFQRKGSEC